MKLFYLRPECGSDNRWGPTLGPFPDYIQLVHCHLTVGPDGDEIGYWIPQGLAETGEENGWIFYQNYWDNPEDDKIPIHIDGSFGLRGRNWWELGWSDVVIWSTEGGSHEM